jgi:hypothetical protein
MNVDFPRSTTQRRAFRRCGYLWLQQYGQGWKPVWGRGVYEFGHVMEALAALVVVRAITTEAEAVERFLQVWRPLEARTDLKWSTRTTWGTLRDRGPELAKLVVRELPPRVSLQGQAHQETIDFELAPGVREKAIPDFYGLVRKGGTLTGEFFPTVVDFKTGDREYMPMAAEIDEQLTDYQLAEESVGRPVEQVGFCVMIYTPVPKIQWLFTPKRGPEEVARFVDSAVAIDRLIREDVFVRNDRACFQMGECPNVPLCYPSQRHRVATELVRTKPSELEAVGWDDDGA